MKDEGIIFMDYLYYIDILCESFLSEGNYIIIRLICCIAMLFLLNMNLYDASSLFFFHITLKLCYCIYIINKILAVEYLHNQLFDFCIKLFFFVLNLSIASIYLNVECLNLFSI